MMSSELVCQPKGSGAKLDCTAIQTKQSSDAAINILHLDTPKLELQRHLDHQKKWMEMAESLGYMVTGTTIMLGTVRGRMPLRTLSVCDSH